MKAKWLLTLLPLLFTLLQVNGQAHDNSRGGCKLFKNHISTGYVCPACEAQDKKEQAAREAEDKRRTDAVNAKVEAERKAAENARLEKIRLANEAEKKRKDKEIADKIAHDNALKRYKEIAAKGLVTSHVKGGTPDIVLSDIQCFKDDKRKVYGFKINNQEALTFPYDAQAMNIDKIEGSNLFAVDVWETPNKYAYSYIIDLTGKKICVDGICQSDYRITSDRNNKVIFFYNRISIETTDRVVNPANDGLGNFHNSKATAVADVQSHRKGGWGMNGPETICYDTRYTLDFNGNVLEKMNGYTIRIIN